ncbi:hypothetical protein HZS_6338, partial [Henneguya salminicola]
MKHQRKMIGPSLDFEDCKIGGAEITVEIDYSKVGKPQYHKGHPVLEESYLSLGKLYKHHAVNYSGNFTDACTVAHFNTIEGTWSA